MPPQPQPEMPQMPQNMAQNTGNYGQPEIPVEEAPVTDEQKQALLSMVKEIKVNMNSFHAITFAANNKTEVLRKDLLRQVFEKLQMAGVDLSDRQSVADFMKRLQDQNPELAKMFENSMNVLLGTAEEGAFNAPPDMMTPQPPVMGDEMPPTGGVPPVPPTAPPPPGGGMIG